MIHFCCFVCSGPHPHIHCHSGGRRGTGNLSLKPVGLQVSSYALTRLDRLLGEGEGGAQVCPLQSIAASGRSE